MKSRHNKVVVLTRQAVVPTFWVFSCLNPGASYAQEATRQSITGEQSAKSAARISPETFTFNWGRAGVQVEAKAETEFTTTSITAVSEST